MARGTLSERVERLELTVQGLEALPGVVAGLREDLRSQILQLRTEMHVEFSTVRGELGGIRRELGAIRGELPEKLDENWQRTRALHEHLIEQIKTMGEHGDPSGSGSKRRPRRKP
jgi:hypothetical protein